jgi:hypothetical protein
MPEDMRLSRYTVTRVLGERVQGPPPPGSLPPVKLDAAKSRLA